MVLFRWYRRLVLLLLLLAALVGASLYLFVFAPTNAPSRADAVVVLSGSVADRIPHALALMRAGTAPVLVVSDGREKDGSQSETTRADADVGRASSDVRVEARDLGEGDHRAVAKLVLREKLLRHVFRLDLRRRYPGTGFGKNHFAFLAAAVDLGDQ